MQRIAAPPTSRAAGKTKFFVGGGLIILAILALIVNGVRAGGSYYLTLDELALRGDTIVDKGVRVNAVVDKDSVQYDSQAITLSFDMVNPETGARRAVVYNQPMPDQFMRSESVIVEGAVNGDGTLIAHSMLVKCPSKYEEAEAEGQAAPADHFEMPPAN